VNAYNTLVEWASEVGSGSWRTWRESCHYLGLEENSAARKLAALGHVEFDWVSDRFAATPPAAVLTLHSSGCLLLTGARRRGARDRLEELYEDEDRAYDIDLRTPVAQDRGPSTWLVEAELDELERFCIDAGYALEIDSGRRIAHALPQASLELCAEEARPDPRFSRRWYDPKLRCLRTNVPAGWDGLWWVKEDRRDVAFIRRRGDWYRIAVREYGPYLAYPDQSFLTYHSGLCSLSVDNQAPLPPLLARAATLQSGRLAKRDGASRHTYVNIDDELAELVQEKLDTPIDWK
jgi:hypothetical protein